MKFATLTNFLCTQCFEKVFTTTHLCSQTRQGNLWLPSSTRWLERAIELLLPHMLLFRSLVRLLTGLRGVESAAVEN